jgi:hypothetical protein
MAAEIGIGFCAVNEMVKILGPLGASFAGGGVQNSAQNIF